MEYLELSPLIYGLLFIVGFTSGLVDSVAGGGGLIALPTLLFIGLPPQVALGTNKLQGSFGTFSASWNYIRHGSASLKDGKPGIVFTLIGAAIGALAVQRLEPDIIRPLIPILLVFVFLYTLFSPKLGLGDSRQRMRPFAFFIVFGLSLGFYDGFFGPGTGSFWTMAFMLIMGFNMTKATGYTKIMNFISNIVALSLFIVGGNVCYPVGLIMAAGQMLGARTGSGLAIKNGARFIRPVFLTVVFLTIARLIYEGRVQWLG